MEPFVFRAQRAVPDLGIQIGDLVVVDPGTVRPVTIERELPANYGRLLGAAECGDLDYLTPRQPLSALRQAVGQNHPPVFSEPRRRRSRHLYRLK